MTIEVAAGTDGTGVIVVSGASPYGDYQPMPSTEYYTVPLTGNLLVEQTFAFGMDFAMNPYDPITPPFAIDPLILIAIAGIVLVVIIIVIVKRR